MSSEFAPLAKTGGLADVLGALSRFLHDQGHDIRPFLPFYSLIDTRDLMLAPVAALQNVPLSLGLHRYVFSVFTARVPGSSLPVYLVQCPALYDRPAIYGQALDEHRRFLLLTRAAIESCQRMGFAPDIFHCHDWHTALAPLYLRTLYAWDRLFASTKTVLTIHNIGYQGVTAATQIDDFGLGDAVRDLDAGDLKAGRINSLKHGILYSDCITTVSPTYAHEIRTPEYGMGLETILETRADSIVGILNGVDYSEWSPENDRYLTRHFSAKNFEPKAAIKRSLLDMLKLKAGEKSPLIGIVSRMARQKGFDLLFEALPALLKKHDFRLVALGSGEARYEEFFTSLQRRFPDQVAFRRGYHEELAHVIEAGSDMFLMPSLYEPCGLNQMYSLRYGTIPIVRNTGGLADSVQHFNPSTKIGTGIVFNDFDTPGVSWAIETALKFYKDTRLWRRIMRNAMAQDFSWLKQGAAYVELYRRLTGLTEHQTAT